MESQISPIPPERYGDRFVRFISGITKSQELAEVEKVEKEAEAEASSDEQRRHQLVRSPTEKVMDKAEKQTERSSRELAREGEAPNRQLSTARSPSAERGEQGGFTLPVVEEAVESGSTGGRSENNITPSPPLQPEEDKLMDRGGQKPPPTPPKDNVGHSTDSPSFIKPANGEGPPTPPSEKEKRRTRLDVDKELPPPPPQELTA